MIRRVLLGVTRFLTSTVLTVVLLVLVSLWSMLATLVPQGAASSRDVTVWAASHSVVEPLVRVLGLHQAFGSIAFVACVLLLALSTVVCSWRRTKTAIRRTRALRDGAAAGPADVAATHELEIVCDPSLTASEAMDVAARTLGRLGIRTKRRGEVLDAVSPWWSVWGSPVFHWALVALIVVIVGGRLQRSEGSMAIAVGQTKADAPASYLSIEAGPWRSWSRVDRSIRLDALEPDYKTGGVDRGAVPTVSVLDGAGNVLVKQRVYPNNMLHSGSLSINAPAVGLSAVFAVLDSRGAETGRIVQYVDFSQTATDGTVPVRVFTRADTAGGVAMRLYATVPLDRYGGGYGEWIPQKPSAHLVVTDAQGAPLLDRVLHPGEEVSLPGGGAVRLLDVDWYSRLSLVDDSTIPLIYMAMVIAMIGLSMTLFFRQQLLVATADEGPDGTKLLVKMRLWRNVPTNRAEIETELVRALSGNEKEETL